MSVKQYAVDIRSRGRTIVTTENFPVPQNEITFLFGESGIGKSMVSKAVYGLLDPGEIDVVINGRPYAAYLADPETVETIKRGFFVFQEPSSHLNPLMRISEQLGEGSLKHSTTEKEIVHSLWQAKDDAEIRRFLEVYPKPYRPSGGEKQRVLLAMAFKKIDIFLESGQNDIPAFFVFDEPTGSLDNNYRNLFIKLLFEKYQKRPFTVMIITHDYSIISEVYAKYRQMVGRVHFKELSRINGSGVEVHDFSANDYLTWLQAAKQAGQGRSQEQTVLTMGQNFTIFNRALGIFRDQGRTRPGDLVIRRGEMVYIKAASGVGKTTLAKIIMGLYQAQVFKATLSGVPLSEKSQKEAWQKHIWGKKAGMVFQHADEALDLMATVRESFEGLPLKTALTEDGLKEKLHALFEGEITEGFLNKKVAFLSGGQKQRLNLLRTLILGTDLIILDEPLNGLDFISIKKVLSILEEKRKNGSALLMISHNEEIFDAFVNKDRVYYLSEIRSEL